MAKATAEEVRKMFEQSGALLEGHFRFTSGRHGDLYFEKIRIAQRPSLVARLGRLMADTMSDVSPEVDVVCAPAFGAIVFGFATALEMGKPFAFLQRDREGRMKIRSGFTVLEESSTVLLVEDVTTTGGSIRESCSVLESMGASVRMVGLLVDRTDGQLELGVPYRALLTVRAESWPAEECPLCKRGVPIHTPGSSRKTD
jgi:orotate phosphoribosyltransferase